ncbi:MAG TPA: hypothetical protein PLC15_02605 [Candidatus Obscuribacter sp.]|nr:hypothetical protein [Candidatus Obscuribacter sp.]
MAFPLNIQETNVSLAWLKVMHAILDAPRHEVAPLVVSVGGFGPDNSIPEHPGIRAEVDKFIIAHGQKGGCHTVANTIFPVMMYKRAGFNRQTLFADYKLIFSRIQEAEKSLNKRGLYFERMIQGNGGGAADNQLEYIINRFNTRNETGVKRRSALQVSIFRPIDDHQPTPYLNFPCLQHISVVPNKDTGTLCLNAFYAQQDVIRKAYGNYLGLSRLAAFIAREMSLKLDTVTCFIGTEKIEAKVKMPALREFVSKLDNLASGASNG